MVSSIAIGRMGKEEEERTPPWLKPMLRAKYFNPCSIHCDSNKSECNHFCLDCRGPALCPSCLIHHQGHHYVQIRRSSYHNVVRVSEIQRYIDISCVQTYIINSAKIVFLNERPQPRPGKGVTYTCEICCRSLVDAFRFCSLGCKLGGMERGDPDLSFTVRFPKGTQMNQMYNHIRGSESDESTTPKKIAKTTQMFNRLMMGESNATSSDDEATANNLSPSTPPLYNDRNAGRRRRKGIPHRAPFF
ncbi:PREDICTED: uncharacterized protein LOC101308091 [Fragaria vesca subsp. vesca]|uniref:uncharacterized protein LOC101308091 n=1 Tax=Fragaria vesca subsp. vesca TaxID=101020 RepID=UPI0002C2DFFF|nr:PREDICTED: uncharacterized protein LOC101308091 [Fragaria vesca subsp. vesca]